MSFDVDVEAVIGTAEIRCRIEPAPGLTVLFGPSGVGKTSVLNMIAGLTRPARGRVAVAGAELFDSDAGIDVDVAGRHAGYVFQESRLFPHMRVRANLGYGAGRGAGRFDFDETIAFLGIAHLLDRWPRSLSGGEARRVAIGRALLSAPSFLLLDEPLSSLDRARAEEIMRAIEHIRDDLQLPILMVTHDTAEAERLGTRIITMDR